MTEKSKPVVEEQPVCEICGEKSVIKENDGHRYCWKHHLDWCKCITHEFMVKMWEGKGGRE